ncbi:MAG: Gfo/Idh/MocA family oxidoreductase [Candidatus Bathyarchaeia archaeon]
MAVIGVGGWGKNYLRVYSRLKQLCTLKAICDIDESRAKYYGEMYKVAWYTDMASLLQREDVDALNICTPPQTHYNLALEAIKAGKHVLVEKPMALTSSQAVEVYREAKKRGLCLMVGFIERFNSGVLKLKDLIDTGSLGVTRFISATRISPWAPTANSIGVTLDTAIHDVDTIRFITGQNPVRVYAEVPNQNEGRLEGRETSVEILLRFRGDLSAYLVAEWLKPAGERINKIRQLQVTGSEGVAILSYIPQLVWRISAVDVLSPFVSEDGRPKYSRDPRDATLIEPLIWLEPLEVELKNFIQSITNGDEPVASGVDGIRAVEIVEMASRSVEAGKPQTITYRAI